MNEQTESAFFPVPVRWFELPQNTARWGFMRLADVAETRAEESKNQLVENALAASVGLEAPVAGRVGQLLNTRA